MGPQECCISPIGHGAISQKRIGDLPITIAEIAGNALQRAAIMETLEQRVADRTRGWPPFTT